MCRWSLLVWCVPMPRALGEGRTAFSALAHHFGQSSSLHIQGLRSGAAPASAAAVAPASVAACVAASVAAVIRRI